MATRESVGAGITVDSYLAALPQDTRAAIEAVRAMVLKHLPEGYVEGISWGMISYDLPLSRFPNTYNKQPLNFAGIAARKNYNSLYLCSYGDADSTAAIHAAFESSGKKLDMGKGCVRFRTAADLPLEALGEILAAMTVERFVARYEASRKKQT